jgi:hypothetical protein
MATNKTTTNRKTNGSKGKKRTPAPQASKLESLSQTTGKTYESKGDKITRARELEEILGIPTISPFKTNDPGVFEKNLEGANLTDLQAMAVRVGVFPSGNKTTLKNKLKRAFKSSLSGQGAVQLGGEPMKLDPKNPTHKEVLDYLND